MARVVVRREGMPKCWQDIWEVMTLVPREFDGGGIKYDVPIAKLTDHQDLVGRLRTADNGWRISFEII